MPAMRITVAATLRLACLAVAVAMMGCVSSSDGEGADASMDATLDPRLRQIAAAQPDSVIGVLIRTSEPIDSEARAALEAEGLAVGTVAGDVVTGRLRAGAATAVAQLPFVVYIEAAQRVPPVQSRHSP